MAAAHPHRGRDGAEDETAPRTNAWARDPELVAVREHLASLPEPVLRDGPGFDGEPEQDPAHLALHRDDSARRRLGRELDANLPGRWKPRRYEPIATFDEYLAKADDEGTTGLLDWLPRAGHHGEGVLLW